MAGILGIKAYGYFTLAAGESKTFNIGYCLIMINNSSNGRSFCGYKGSDKVVTIYETVSSVGNDYGDIGVTSISGNDFKVTNNLSSSVTLRIIAISSHTTKALVGT